MATKDKKNLTFNQYNIVGKKVDVDFHIIKEYKSLEEITLKNFEINDEVILIINELELLKSISLVNCKINTSISIARVSTIELINCIFNKNIFSENIKNLYIDSCNQIDINDFKNLNLKSLRIENTKAQNLSKISEFIDLENLYLNEIDLNENINYENLINLKRLNLDGSNIENREMYLKQFENRNIEISFTKENKRIG